MTQLIQTLATDIDTEVISKIRSNPDKVFFPNFGNGDNILSEGFTVDRVMFTIPGINFKVYWYGFLIAVGILLAMIYGFKRMKDVGVDPDRATDGVIAGFFGAIFGARLYYIMFNDDTSFSQFFNIRDGGLAIYGGIIGAIVVGGIVVRVRKVKLTALLDVVGPCFLIGQAIGRWGNFFNQEAFGSNTDLPWGMMSSKTINYIAEHFDDLGGEVSSYAPVHPCFLYESLWCIAAFVFLHFYLRHRKFDGEVFLMYIGLYGLGRFFIESTRTDSLYLMNIKVSQLVAGACVIASIILIIIFRNIVKRNDDYKLYVDTRLSKAQMEEYNTYAEVQKAKKEMKAKIKAAKAAGEDTSELEKEFEEKFGKHAKKPSDDVKEDEPAEKSEKYTSILADDDEETASENSDSENSDNDNEEEKENEQDN
ncbi:phosphatidylglycerol:prolipoprotein diacylglycerol transferase [Ruminococcaceae bacterium FB2012]|nr:phosphatidylglycerol:prolipoprotein diacylglycerol transferase [Ruminococcaceae bacterium FB2012]